MKFLKTTTFTCYGLDGTATFPTSAWDGDSGNRDSDDGRMAAPDYRDWARMVREVAAVQNSNLGVDDNTLHTIGTLGATAGLSVKERGNAAIHKTIITLTNVALATTDGTVPATDAHWATLPLYTFPVGQLVFFGAHFVFPVAGIVATVGAGGGLSDTADLEVGVGTLARGNTSDFALAATEHNLIPEQTGVDLVAASSDAIESSNLAAALHFDGTTACVVNLNIITTDDADAGVLPDLLTLNGTITFVWTSVGDE